MNIVFSIFLFAILIACIYIGIRNILVLIFRLKFLKQNKLEEYKQLKNYSNMVFSFKKLKKENFLKKPK